MQNHTSDIFDIFPNLPNSLPTAKLQMIGCALLSTNFNTLQTHPPSWSCHIFLASYARGWGGGGVHIPAQVREFLKFSSANCHLAKYFNESNGTLNVYRMGAILNAPSLDFQSSRLVLELACYKPYNPYKITLKFTFLNLCYLVK